MKGLFPLLYGENVRGPAGHQARQFGACVHRYLLGRQRAHVHAADRGETQKALVQLGYDQADFVHVGRQHHASERRIRALLAGNEIAERVDAYFVHQGRNVLADERANAVLLPAYAGRFAQLFK